MAVSQKVYIVQRHTGEIVAAKLVREIAQSIAKAHAPCKVVLVRADKTPDVNGPGSR